MTYLNVNLNNLIKLIFNGNQRSLRKYMPTFEWKWIRTSEIQFTVNRIFVLQLLIFDLLFDEFNFKFFKYFFFLQLIVAFHHKFHRFKCCHTISTCLTNFLGRLKRLIKANFANCLRIVHIFKCVQ